MPLALIPFSSGLRGDIDPRLLPDGALADAVNVEMDREGRLAGRARYQALAATSYGSGTFVAYDLFSVGDRLFALGDRSAQGYPSDVFEYAVGAAATWTPSDRSSARNRLPRATRLRDLSRPPDVSGGVSSFSIAALGGFLLLAYNNTDPVGVKNGYLQLSQPAHDQTLRTEELSTSSNNVCLKLKTLALSDRFLILGTNLAADRLGLRRLIPTSDESSASVTTTLYSGLGTVNMFAACKVEGSDQFVVVANMAGTLIVRRFNSSGVQQTPSGGDYANIVNNTVLLAVYANVADDQIVVAWQQSTVLKIQVYTLSTGATLTSATTQFSGIIVGEISVFRFSADVACIVASGDDGFVPSVYVGTFTASTGGGGTTIRAFVDGMLLTTALLHVSEVIFACRYGASGGVANASGPSNATNLLVSAPSVVAETLATRVQVLAAKDLETAVHPSGTGQAHLPEIVVDASTGKYYWANAVLNPDGNGVPVVTEFLLGAAERRQVAVHGNHVYITGGAPCVFDLRFLCESGFLERPFIKSLTGGSGGSLHAGGTYNYRLHNEWIDSAGDVHLSPPSEISKITLSSVQNKVTASASSGHGMRRNGPASFAGVSVRHVLSRTLATAVLTAAIVVGLTSINPPSSSLNTLTLKLTAGGIAYTVTFSGSATTQATVLSEINAIVSAEVTATAPGGVLVLTSVDTGDGATIEITNGTANTILGLTEGETEIGTTTRTIGENFQRTKAVYNQTADLPGTAISIIDTRPDENNPIVDTDLIRQPVLYSQGIASGAHHAPPPSEFVWAGRERIVWMGQPHRNRYTASKLIVPGEPAEHAAEGFIAFQGQVTGDIEAGCVLGDGIALFTRTQIWIVTGSGPNRAGQGEFFAAQCVSRKLGIKLDGWRSLLEDDQGVWFQGSDSQLYHLSRGGEVTWKGKAIREYLSSYPVIVAATARTLRQELAFAVTNTAGNTGGILRYRPDIDGWFFDDVGAVTALADYQGRLAYIQGGIVYLQDAAPGSGTGPDYYVSTGMFQGFQALGYGAVNELGFLGTFRGNCTVTIHESIDGVSFGSAIASWSLTTAEYAVNQRVTLKKPPRLQVRDSMALRFKVSGMSSSEGVWLHAAALETTQAPRLSRQGPAHVL